MIQVRVPGHNIAVRQGAVGRISDLIVDWPS